MFSGHLESIYNNVLLACERSLKYIIHSSGPRIEPCVTPVVIDKMFDFKLPIFVYCF